MSPKILSRVEVSSISGQYYGTLEVFDIRYENGSLVNIQEFLGITLQSPVEVFPRSVTIQLSPYVETSVTVINTQAEDDGYDVQIKASFAASSLIAPGSKITIGVNGDLTSSSDRWADSVSLFGDEVPDKATTLSPRWSLRPSTVLARLASQPVTLTAFIGGMIRKGLGCCFGRDDLVDEKLPGEITLKA